MQQKRVCFFQISALGVMLAPVALTRLAQGSDPIGITDGCAMDLVRCATVPGSQCKVPEAMHRTYNVPGIYALDN